MGYPQTITKEPCSPKTCAMEAGSSAGKVCPPTSVGDVGTSTVVMHYKQNSSFTSYVAKADCLQIPLRRGGALSLRWNQFPGVNTILFPMAPEGWETGGRGGMFSFLPYIPLAYQTTSQLGVNDEAGTSVFAPITPAIGTVTYYRTPNNLEVNGRFDSATKVFRQLNGDTGEEIAFGGPGHALFGRPLTRLDRNGNQLAYVYAPRVPASGYGQLLRKITGDLAITPYFAYATESGPAAPITRIFLYDAANPAGSRAIYFTYQDPSSDALSFLQKITFPGGCTRQYQLKSNSGSGTGHTGIVSETDAEGFRSRFYYDYNDSQGSGSIVKTVEPTGRVTYYDYSSYSSTLVARAGRQSEYYSYLVDAVGSSQIKQHRDALGRKTIFGWDTGLSRIRVKTDPHGLQTYYAYNVLGNVVAETRSFDQGVKRLGYTATGWDVAKEVGPRFQAGVVPAVSYYEYDAKRNRVAEVSPVGGRRVSAFDASGRKVKEVDALGRPTYFRYETTAGRVGMLRDAAAGITYHRWSGFGERLATVSPRWSETGNQAAFTTRMGYDARSRLVKHQDPRGSTTYLSYTNRGDVAARQDARGVTTWSRYDGLRHTTRTAVMAPGGALLSARYFEYDSNGNQAKAINERGFATLMAHDALDRLVATTDPLGGVTYFAYDLQGNRNRMRNALGRVSVSEFDPLGRKVATTDALNGRMYFAYDLGGNLIKRRDQRGNSAVRLYDAADRMIAETNAVGAKSYFVYDASNNLTRHRDALGRVTLFIVDRLDRRVAVINAKAESTYFGYDAVGNLVKQRDARAYTTRSTYDATDRRTTITDALGGVVYYGYDQVGNLVKTRDELGRTTQFTVDGLDRMVAVSDPLGGSSYFGYDRAGNLTKERDQRQATWTMTYDQLNRMVASSDPLGAVIYFGYDAVGKVVSMRDAFEQTTTLEYDGLSRRVAIIDALGGKAYFGYDAVGSMVKWRDQRGNVTQYAYDQVNRLAAHTDPLGGRTYFGYDAAGNIVKRRDPLGGTGRNTFDVLNRKSSTIDPNGAKTYFAYDAAGNLTTSIDALLRTTTTVFDALSRPTRVTDPTTAAMQIGYDAVGRVRKQVDALGRATYFSYDALRRLAQQIDPLNIRTYFTYDATSKLSGRTVKSADVAAMSVRYDLRGRKRWCQETTGPGSYFAYDLLGNLLSTTDQTGATARSYDELNRLSLVVSPRGDATYFGYSPTSQRTKVQFPRGTSRATLAYDALDRLRKLRSPTNRDVYYVYDAASRPRKMRFGSGASCYYAFDAAHRPTQIRHVSTTGATIAQFLYRRDAIGRVNRIVREGDVAIYYQYDGADRLTNEAWVRPSSGTQIYGFNYQYDSAGNRVASTRTGFAGAAIDASTYVYNAANALVKRWITPGNQATYYAYDGSGSTRRVIESAGTTYFEYGRHGLVTRIVPPAAKGQPWSFGYDAVLNRTRMVRGDNGKASYFTWDGLAQLEERDAAGVLVARYIHGRGIVPGVGSIVEVQRPSVPLGSQFLHTDHQGSVHKVTDAYGRVQVSYTMDAFGRHLQAPSGMTPTMANDIAFHGDWLSVNIGGRKLGLTPSRVYDAEIGLFLQRDPYPLGLKVARSSGVMGLEQATIFAGLYAEGAGTVGDEFVTYAPTFIPNGIDPLGMKDKVPWEDYFKDFLKKHPGLTPAQKKWVETQLARGCVGVTCSNLGASEKFNNCYKEKKQADARKKKMEKDCVCSKNKSSVPLVFSIHLRNDKGTDPAKPDLTFHPKTGKADLTNWDMTGRPAGPWKPAGGGGYNFDFGFVEKDGTITHADHYHNPDKDMDGKGDYYPNMDITDSTIFKSTLAEWQKKGVLQGEPYVNYPDFNAEVWCVQCSGKYGA